MQRNCGEPPADFCPCSRSEPQALTQVVILSSVQFPFIAGQKKYFILSFLCRSYVQDSSIARIFLIPIPDVLQPNCIWNCFLDSRWTKKKRKKKPFNLSKSRLKVEELKTGACLLIDWHGAVSSKTGFPFFLWNPELRKSNEGFSRQSRWL